jgi:antirestriction protein
MSEFRIWFGSLAAYNAGVIRGEWISLPTDEEHLRRIYNLYTANGDHDFYIADWELPFDIGEYEDIFKLNTVLEEYEKLDDWQRVSFEFLVDQENMDFDEAMENLDNVVIHCCRTFEELAEQFVDDGMFGNIPSHLSGYIDYEAIGRDLSFDGFYTEWKDKIVEYRN